MKDLLQLMESNIDSLTELAQKQARELETLRAQISELKSDNQNLTNRLEVESSRRKTYQDYFIQHNK